MEKQKILIFSMNVLFVVIFCEFGARRLNSVKTPAILWSRRTSTSGRPAILTAIMRACAVVRSSHVTRTCGCLLFERQEKLWIFFNWPSPWRYNYLRFLAWNTSSLWWLHPRNGKCDLQISQDITKKSTASTWYAQLFCPKSMRKILNTNSKVHLLDSMCVYIYQV